MSQGKKRQIYRRRMSKAGMLVQMSSSQHRWIPSLGEKWWFVARCDDADGYGYGKFHEKESAFSNMSVLRNYIEGKGVFMGLYVDKASHFKTTRHGGLHYQVSQEQGETQIQRALRELGIEVVYANSLPRPKGG